MVWWQVILFPFAILYNLVTRFRNHLFNIGYTRAFDFEVNTIVVGNLSVGGTGKSPMVSYLLEKLQHEYPAATLSRGYGRKSRGFLVASEESSARDIGDEPYMFYQRHGNQATIAAGEDRAYAIPGILYEAPATQLILLDDAFQHRTVKAGLNVLLTRYDRPFYDDYLLPSGQLRESRTGAKRADLIVMTKCPDDLDNDGKDRIISNIRTYADAPVYFTKVAYQAAVAFDESAVPEVTPKSFVVVAGIAHNADFVAYCQEAYSIKEVFTFPDHHNYTEKDLIRIADALNPQTGLLTTEKDWVKLKTVKGLQGFACYYVPIKTVFLDEESQFLEEVKNSLKEYPHETVVQPQDH
ncbi:MAG: tetraacyldisaccharide 4'-kinase [Cytophagales bacterium]|nr:tetraacyldisaccharide 4'-kinase [Cytophagales bacterium]